MTGPADLLADAFRRDPSRPLVTSYDETTGARVELSVATTVNWVAKLGNAFTDEWDLAPGDTVEIDLPAHWVGVVAALAVWAVGGEVVAAGSDATASISVGVPALTEDSLIVALDPMGLDLSRLVSTWPDALLAGAPSGGLEITALATKKQLPPGARILSTAALDSPASFAASVVAPLIVNGSVVVVRGDAGPERLAEIAKVEQVTDLD